jgi:hypothetical protein
VTDDTRDLTDEQLQRVIEMLIAELRPFQELTARLLTVVESLQHRVEVLELHRMHAQAAPGDDRVLKG